MAAAFIRGINHHLKLKKSLGTQAVTYMFSASLAAGAIAYTMKSKADISINRWGNRRPMDKVDQTRPGQKLFTALDEDRRRYKIDEAVAGLQKEIYQGLEFYTRSPPYLKTK
ncbi:uncharacterized protein LOC144746114 [Ciona intestinalis]